MKKNKLIRPGIAAAKTVPFERMQPGIIVLNRAGKLLYLNLTAKTFLDATQRYHPSFFKPGTLFSSGRDILPFDRMRRKRPVQLLDLIAELHGKLTARTDGPAYDGTPAAHPIFLKNNLICFLRAFLLQNPSKSEEGAHLLILIEALPSVYNASKIQTPHLTEREQSVVRRLFEGKTNKEVAASIGISEHTVKEHIKRIMKKLSVTTRAGIVAHFVQPLLRTSETALIDAASFQNQRPVTQRVF